MKIAHLLLVAVFLVSPALAYSKGGAEKYIPSASAISAYDVVDSFGICAHVGQSTPENAENITRMLSYLEIKYVRFDPDTEGTRTAVAAEINANLGVKFVGVMKADSRANYEARRDVVLNNIDIFEAVEGNNEVNNAPVGWDGLPVYEAERAAMEKLYDDFKDITKVYSMTLALNVAESIYQGLVSNYAPWHSEYLSTHIYPITWDRSAYQSMVDKVALDGPLSPNTPVAFTEVGAYTRTSTGDYGTNKSAVSEEIQAKNNINALMNGVLLGYYKTFLYELVDAHVETTFTDSERHFGQFLYSTNPKVSATAIHNLVSLLKDGAPARLHHLDYTITGLDATAHSILIQKEDGSHFIALWQDKDMWNNSTASEIEIADIPVTITFPLNKKVSVFDPLLGKVAQSVEYGTTHEIDVPDHVILVKVEKP